jgi:hypothetical protein
VHEGLEDKRVVDGVVLDVGLQVPAGLAAAGSGAVHDVISDKEASLKDLNSPSKSKSLALNGSEVDTVLGARHTSAGQNLHSTEVLATLASVNEHATKAISDVLREIVLSEELSDETFDKAIKRVVEKNKISRHSGRMMGDCVSLIQYHAMSQSPISRHQPKSRFSYDIARNRKVLIPI